MSDIPDDAPAPRLSIIVQWPEFDGYGFNLHAEKTKPGQYIGQVDPNSPAEVAGLVEGDRIIEVNGVNIANENHKQVKSSN
ncbi:Na(+)/H(+) exchange regulatory cofactor NHE-RF1-like [Homarus americanus]|uniref:Na(+)/H(+) exchange regulatory cofactor NHE-RF1-like n=1 Tax=Homarus americanus TaxID=6706 RepID=A0A8J5JLP2_HOMAM|nr:Na(+)/H(+) exchange regulatory cofactor NHE-RF1-like [Homarus americanus]